MRIREFAAVLVVCATGCPADGGGGTGPGTTGGANGPTEGPVPTTSGSQGDPTSATGTTGTGTDTQPGATVTGATDTDTGVVDATDTTGVGTAATDTTGVGMATTDTTGDGTAATDTTSVGTAATDTTDTTGDGTAATDTTGDVETSTTGTTGTTGDAETDATGPDSETGGSQDPPKGTLPCKALEFEEPIVIDDFSMYQWGLRALPAIAVSWREEMVLARAQRRIDGTPTCEVWWDRRDDAGQKLGETVVIPVPATANSDTNYFCEMVGDIVWDAAHQRYIFLHPQSGDAPEARSLPLAISPDGELVWTASGALRRGIYHHGVVSQMRILGDELYVFGQNYPTNTQSRPAVHVYSTTDGAWLRTITPPITNISEGAIACDATCTQGAFIGNKSGLKLWEINMKTGALIGEPVSLGSTSLLGTMMMDWRGDTIFGTQMWNHPANVTYLDTGTLSIDGGWSQKHTHWLPKPGPNSWYEWFEPSWAQTDDGYVVVATRQPWKSELNPGDYRDMRVQVLNLGFDGTIREQTLLPDLRAHTPRVAVKDGRVVITYVHMQLPHQFLDSKRMVFASCPP